MMRQRRAALDWAGVLSLEPVTDDLVEVAPRSHGDGSGDETGRLATNAKRPG
jgi:hypothetical protein